MDCGHGSISLMLNVTRTGKDCRGISRSFWEYGFSPLGMREAPYKARTCNRVMTVEFEGPHVHSTASECFTAANLSTFPSGIKGYVSVTKIWWTRELRV